MSDLQDLAQCCWRSDFPADKIAYHMKDKDYRVAEIFHYLEVTDLRETFSGFEVAVDEAAAMQFIRSVRPGAYPVLRLLTDSPDGRDRLSALRMITP